MKPKRLTAASALLALSFLPFRSNGRSFPETEERISHAYVGEDSASLEKLRAGNTDESAGSECKFPSNEYTALVGFYAVSPLGQ